MTMSLRTLLAPYAAQPVPDILVKGLALDSRLIQPGEAFFALLGTREDGRRFIQDAIARGAVAVVTELSAPLDLGEWPIPVVYIAGLTKKVSRIAGKFYGHPSSHLKVLATTGTNGKTTCTQLLAQAYTHLGIPATTIGTLGLGTRAQFREASLTTPDAISLQRILHMCVEEKEAVVAMEVSSHALDQGRVEDIRFSSAIFTNLTQDHLDYHGSMNAYGLAKQHLFELPHLKNAILNADDPFSRTLIRMLSPSVTPISYTVEGINPLVGSEIFYQATALQPGEKGIRFRVMSPYGTEEVHLRLIGAFNVSNALAVLATLVAEGVPFSDACQVLGRVDSAAGRMQRLGGGNLPWVVVDYAHTPDALKQVLIALRAHCKRRLWVVFGCGGDRDKGKRPLMAQAALQYADKVVVTTDNPRTEDPRQIAQDILEGCVNAKDVIVELDRREAIRYAVLHALPEDIILVAGKGHEKVQIVGHEKIPFEDAECVTTVLNEVTNAVI